MLLSLIRTMQVALVWKPASLVQAVLGDAKIASKPSSRATKSTRVFAEPGSGEAAASTILASA